MSNIACIRDLRAAYGVAEVLFGIDMDVRKGEVTALIGRNGMGKTTTIRCLMGLLKPSHGSISINCKEMTGLPPYTIAQAGVGLVPEGRQVFPSLTVSENLRATSRFKSGGWTEELVLSYFLVLEKEKSFSHQLSGGEQQMLAIGRALMTNPTLLVLDEATEGLAPLIRAEIWAILGNLKSSGTSILLVDKNLDELVQITDYFYTIEKGRVVWDGDVASFKANRDQVESFLRI